MERKELESKTTNLRTLLLKIANKIKHESLSENSSKVDTTFTVAADLLSNPTYDIVVCGEVKKGKSSFLNAVIGQDILPTAVREATSQVFRISNSKEESFALVFTDGTSAPITKEELSRYGSQVDADLLGEPIFKNKFLEYIQVNLPIEFLPEGVSLVDIPGLGALYESHERITNQYVKNAAAVIFVLDPSGTLVKPEQTFL